MPWSAASRPLIRRRRTGLPRRAGINRLSPHAGVALRSAHHERDVTMRELVVARDSQLKATLRRTAP